MPRRLLRVAFVAGLLALACRPPVPPPREAPRLAVLLVIDQGRYDYLVRFRPLFSGGLARLLDRGVSFTEARHAHAATETAPGHSALATGLYPAHSRIVGNSWYDRREHEEVYAVGDRRDGRSPRRLRGSALGDWLRARYPRSKVFAASAKDRAAILLGGRRPNGAFWYDATSGGFTSSHYYGREASPVWLERWNEEHPAAAEFGRLWEPLDPAFADAAAAEGIERLDEGVFAAGFPHALGGTALVPGESFYRALYNSPFIDARLAAFAKALVREEDLGGDEWPDLLALSFSATDTVGHLYGPNSPEALDTLLRLDRQLGDLLDFLAARVGEDHLLVALSADHGVAPLPELRRAHGEPGARLGALDVACGQRLWKELRRRFGDEEWIVDGSFVGGVYLDRDLLAKRGIDPAVMETAVAEILGTCPAVRRVWTESEVLGTTRAVPDPDLVLYRNGWDRERSPDLEIELRPYEPAILGRRTTHGSPYDYDRHVPLVVGLPGTPPRQVREPVETVDLAPTLAALLGVPVPEGIDGRSLAEFFSSRKTSIPPRGP